MLRWPVFPTVILKKQTNIQNVQTGFTVSSLAVTHFWCASHTVCHIHSAGLLGDHDTDWQPGCQNFSHISHFEVLSNILRCQETVLLALCLQLTAKTDALLHLPLGLKSMWKTLITSNNSLTVDGLLAGQILMGCDVNNCSFKHSLGDLCHKYTRHAND